MDYGRPESSVSTSNLVAVWAMHSEFSVHHAPSSDEDGEQRAELGGWYIGRVIDDEGQTMWL